MSGDRAPSSSTESKPGAQTEAQTEAGVVRVDHEADIARIVLDRPATGNVLTREMTLDLARLLAELPHTTKAVFISGAGDDFCAGRESPMPKPGAVLTASMIRARVADPVLDFYEQLRNVPVPVISVVRGRAFGVGCALAGLADIVIADDTAQFMIPEMNRDIPPLLVMTALAHRVQRAGLARMVLGREAIDGSDACAIGLASETCPAAKLDERVSLYTAAFEKNSRASLSAVKRFLNAAPEASFALLKELAATTNSSVVSERFVTPT